MAFRSRPGQIDLLEYLIGLYTPEIRDAFLLAIQDIVDEAILAEVIRAIENGEPDKAFEVLGFNQAAMKPLLDAIERSFERGGIMTGENFPKYLRTPSGRAVFRFDMRNSRAEAWLRDKSSMLVRQLSDDARENVRTTLYHGMTEGRNPRSVALDIVGRVDTQSRKRVGGVIGLTTQQESWVSSARRYLNTLDERYFAMKLRDKRFDRIVQRSISLGTPLPKDTIDKLVIAYRNNALRYRGEMIGRTEAIQALNRAQFEAHLQAVDMGALRVQDIVRVWDSAGDNRVRWSHKRLDEQKRIGLDDAFESPSGARMMFPGDTSLGAPASEVIACRCRVRLEVDFLAQWEDDD